MLCYTMKATEVLAGAPGKPLGTLSTALGFLLPGIQCYLDAKRANTKIQCVLESVSVWAMAPQHLLLQCLECNIRKERYRLHSWISPILPITLPITVANFKAVHWYNPVSWVSLTKDKIEWIFHLPNKKTPNSWNHSRSVITLQAFRSTTHEP